MIILTVEDWDARAKPLLGTGKIVIAVSCKLCGKETDKCKCEVEECCSKQTRGELLKIHGLTETTLTLYNQGDKNTPNER